MFKKLFKKLVKIRRAMRIKKCRRIRLYKESTGRIGLLYDKIQKSFNYKNIESCRFGYKYYLNDNDYVKALSYNEWASEGSIRVYELSINNDVVNSDDFSYSFYCLLKNFYKHSQLARNNDKLKREKNIINEFITA